MNLSILICHVPERKLMLDELLDCLESQYDPAAGLVEVLVDPCSGSVGEKRNRLLCRAKGDYLAFVDDDDMVSTDYIPRILAAIRTSPDVVGMRGVLMQGNHPGGLFEHSIKHAGWSNNNPTGAAYTRPANHLSPVRREIALQCRFPEISFGEDKSYSDQIAPLLHTEVMIESPIYLYNYRQK